MALFFFFVSLMLRQVEGRIESLERYGGSYFAFVIIGVAVSTNVDAALRTFGLSIRTAQVTGTFEAMVSTRARIGEIVAGSGLYTLSLSLVRAVLLVVLAAGVFGMSIHAGAWPVVIIVFALTLTATLAMGIFSAGFIVLFKQGDPLTNAISGLTWLLSGVLYPKEILPPWVQDIAALLPVTHALEALRLSLLQGAPLEALRGPMIGLATFSAVALPVSLTWFAWAVSRARVAGSLARY